MSIEKNMNTRIQHKHDIEANWSKAINFIPKVGEIIIYEADDTHSYARIKIGDGKTNINSLPFSAGSIATSTTDGLMSSADKTKLDSLEEDFATKTYVDSTISGIQIPDVEAQINAHNTSDTAHNDIRELINSIFETKSQVQIITWEADD